MAGNFQLNSVFYFGVVFCAVFVNCVTQDSDNGSRFYELVPTLPVEVLNSNNSQCSKDSRLYLESLKNFTTWAYQMWDASAKQTVGQITGSQFNPGNFHQCLNVNGPIRTQYCLVEVHLEFQAFRKIHKYHREIGPYDHVLNALYFTGDPTQYDRQSISLALCVPYSCSYQDLEDSINVYLKTVDSPNGLNITYSAKVLPQYCTNDRREETLDTYDLLFCLLIVVLCLLTLLSAYVFYSHNNPGKSLEYRSIKLLRCFSPRHNYNNLFIRDPNSDGLNHLYALKVISICSIVIDHTYGTSAAAMLYDMKYSEEYFKKPISVFLVRGDLFVDTFFFISGLLVTIGLLNKFKTTFMNPFSLLLLRYIRLTPVYAVIIFYIATLYFKMSNGPQWNLIIGFEAEACQKNWWTNLLYINNYVNSDQMCMVHAWFMPCDIHYFFIATIVVTILYKNKRLGLSIIAVGFIVSAILQFTITYNNRLPAFLEFFPDFLTNPRGSPTFQLMYTKSHTRMSSYLCGIVSGYFLLKMQQSGVKFSQISTTLWFLSGLFLMSSSLFGSTLFTLHLIKYDPIYAGLFAASNRLIWGIGTGFGVIALSFGELPIVSPFFKAKAWVPLSKLVFTVYLLHMMFLLTSTASSPILTVVNLEFSYMKAGWYIVQSFVVAFFVYLIVEVPLRNLCKELVMPSSSRSTRNDTKVNQVSPDVAITSKDVFHFKSNL